ncbi:hypothetical protein PR048_012351 [Dryococelus australis]|uniref:YqaJ viral recombinase domain-containing protein n=1 Tax=Dryococelus australis TaxID=614101 RepID=A0ABQ9HP60_9NEOP|nr:hypothetical protein PR048_012351 [Dryococelus australis]
MVQPFSVSILDPISDRVSNHDGAAANEHRAEPLKYIAQWSPADRSFKTRNFPDPRRAYILLVGRRPRTCLATFRTGPALNYANAKKSVAKRSLKYSSRGPDEHYGPRAEESLPDAPDKLAVLEEEYLRSLQEECIDERGRAIQKYPYLGATFDGVIDESAIVEIKCPSSSKYMSPEEAFTARKLKFLRKENNTLRLKEHPYFYQVQGQLNMTEREIANARNYTQTHALYRLAQQHVAISKRGGTEGERDGKRLLLCVDFEHDTRKLLWPAAADLAGDFKKYRATDESRRLRSDRVVQHNGRLSRNWLLLDLGADEGDLRWEWSNAGMTWRGKWMVCEEAQRHRPAQFPHAKISLTEKVFGRTGVSHEYPERGYATLVGRNQFAEQAFDRIIAGKLKESGGLRADGHWPCDVSYQLSNCIICSEADPPKVGSPANCTSLHSTTPLPSLTHKTDYGVVTTDMHANKCSSWLHLCPPSLRLRVWSCGETVGYNSVVKKHLGALLRQLTVRRVVGSQDAKDNYPIAAGKVTPANPTPITRVAMFTHANIPRDYFEVEEQWLPTALTLIQIRGGDRRTLTLPPLQNYLDPALGKIFPAGCAMLKAVHDVWVAPNEALRADAGMKERGKREIPEKTRRPATSSGTIPACESMGVARTGIEPEPLVHTVFDTSWRSLAQSSPSTVTADNQCAFNIGIFVHETVESSLQVIEHANFSGLFLLRHKMVGSLLKVSIVVRYQRQDCTPVQCFAFRRDEQNSFNQAAALRLLDPKHKGEIDSITCEVTSGIFACGNRAWTMLLVDGFLEDLPFPPPLRSGCCSKSTSFHPSPILKTLYVSHPNLSTAPLN